MAKAPIILCWSGGKDSALSLHALQTSGEYEVKGLLTTVTGEYDRISMHGVRRHLLEEQAQALGLPLKQIIIPPKCANTFYEERMREACLAYQKQGIGHMAFGDLFLQDIRDYRNKMLGQVGM